MPIGGLSCNRDCCNHVSIFIIFEGFSTKLTGFDGIRMSGHNVAASSGCGFGYPDDGGDVTESGSGKGRDLRIKRDTAVTLTWFPFR